MLTLCNDCRNIIVVFKQQRNIHLTKQHTNIHIINTTSTIVYFKHFKRLSIKSYFDDFLQCALT